MPVGYAIGSDVFDRIKPKIRQWEINKQRRIDPNVLQSMLEAEMSTATKEADTRFFRAQDLEQKQQALDATDQARKDAAKTATVQGAVNIGTLGATAYLGYKGMQNQKTIADAYKTLAGKVNPGGGGQIAVEPSSLTPPGALKTPKDYTFGGGQTADAAIAPPESFGGPTIDMAPVAGDATTFAPVAPVDVGGLAVDASALPAVAAEGGQAALAGEGAVAAGAGAQTAVTTGEAALTAEESAALAADVGVGGEMGAAGLESSAIGLSDVVPPVAVALAGRPIGKMVANALGTHEKTTQDIVETAGYTAAGFMIAGPVGAVAGAVYGVVKGIVDSVVCSELLRQGRISENDRKKCVIFRFRYIPDDMFDAYLEWASPHVEAMRRGGWRNWIRLPFAHAFVGYMISVQDKKVPSRALRLMWAHAWHRCERIAKRNAAAAMKIRGVA